MPRNSRLDASSSAARAVAGEAPDTRATDPIDSFEGSEFPLHFGPARGILTAVAIGAGAWTIILGAAALARAIFFD